MGKYYAVKVGRKPGIYSSWDDCKEQVDGYKGAIYKSFVSQKEALAFIGYEQKQEVGLLAYVDGSFNQQKGRFGYGCVIILNNQVIERLAGFGDDPNYVSMRNVAGEIAGSLIALDYALKNKYSEITIYYDYLGIEKWADGSWQANKPGTKQYRDRVQEYRKYLKINFQKVLAHSGNRYNDLADSLAKKAVGIDG